MGGRPPLSAMFSASPPRCDSATSRRCRITLSGLSLPVLDRQLHGFALPDAVLTAPETRSSSPVRLPRDESGQALAIQALSRRGRGRLCRRHRFAALDGIQQAGVR